MLRSSRFNTVSRHGNTRTPQRKTQTSKVGCSRYVSNSAPCKKKLNNSNTYLKVETETNKHVQHHLRWAFPKLVSYNRFVELQQEVLEPLVVYLRTRFGTCIWISFSNLQHSIYFRYYILLSLHRNPQIKRTFLCTTPRCNEKYSW